MHHQNNARLFRNCFGMTHGILEFDFKCNLMNIWCCFPLLVYFTRSLSNNIHVICPLAWDYLRVKLLLAFFLFISYFGFINLARDLMQKFNKKLNFIWTLRIGMSSSPMIQLSDANILFFLHNLKIYSPTLTVKRSISFSFMNIMQITRHQFIERNTIKKNCPHLDVCGAKMTDLQS